MNGNKSLKIFMLPQEFPCGEQSSCCGPIGQSEEEIQSLKSSIERELGYEIEVLNVKNEDDVKNYPRIVQLLHSLGPAGLPIIALEDEVVSMGNSKTEEVLAAIQEKTEKKVGKENKMIENANSDEVRQESPEDSQACCPSASGSGDCCPPSSGGGKSWKTMVFILIVVAAGVVLARSLIGKSNSAANQTQQLFAAIQPEAKLESPLVPSVVNDMTKEDISDDKAAPALWGPELDSLASLNKVATETDAVFVLLASNDQQSNQNITKEIEAAAKTIKSNGVRVSAFRLNKAVPDYAQLAKQVSIPSVLAMVKGRGMNAVSGEITEANLLSAFVRASMPVSSCGPRSGSSCCPPRPKK